jgi:hypothetical protein
MMLTTFGGGVTIRHDVRAIENGEMRSILFCSVTAPPVSPFHGRMLSDILVRHSLGP